MKREAIFVIGLSAGLAIGFGGGIYTGTLRNKSVRPAQPAAASSQAAFKLAALNARLRELRVNYTDQYPLVQEVKHQIADLQQQSEHP